MWLFFSVTLALMFTALLLSVYLKHRLHENERLDDELVTSGAPADASAVSRLHRHMNSLGDIHETQSPRVEPMTNLPPASDFRSSRDVDLRRSSRVEQPVQLLILGTNRQGEPFQESTSALSMNLHGCRYASRHEYSEQGWVTLQVTGTEGPMRPAVRARVRSLYAPQSLREKCQVGVELETPGNIWGIGAPPEDWQGILGPAVANIASSVAPAPAPTALSSALERHLATPPERKAEVTVFPGPATPPPVASEPPDTKEPAVAKSERVVVTADQLLQALQGRLQQAADRAMQNAISTQLDQSMRTALSRMDEVWMSNARQADEYSASRLTEAQKRWERELVVYRSRAEEISRRLETLASHTQQTLADSQQLLERVRNEIEPQLRTRLEQAFLSASSGLEAKTTELSEKHFAHLTETTEIAAREACTNLNRSVAEVRSMLISSPSGLSEERLESRVNSAQQDALNRMEERLGEVWKQFEQTQDVARQRSDDLAHQIECLTAELRATQSQHEQAIAGIRSLASAPLAPAPAPGLSPEQLDPVIDSLKKEFRDLLEWRLGEVSAHFEQMHEGTRRHSEEFAQRSEALVADSRAHLDEARKLAENASREVARQDNDALEQSTERAARDFETAAARISDRHVVRLMEQKQAVANETSLEMEARATEARALLQRAANSAIEEFRRRVESQMESVMAEAIERAASSLASLEAESRAAAEARRRELVNDVARAAEQSTAEFRAGIKAFLYSCMVSAVHAVDEHAQNTMASLAKDPSLPPPIEAPTDQSSMRSSAASASSSGTDSC